MNVRTIVGLVLAGAAFAAFAAEKPHDLPPEGFALTDWQKDHMPPPLATRLAQIKPVAQGELRLRPTFSSCGVAWGSGREVADLAFEYRKRGETAWTTAPKPLWFFETGDMRGSLLYLAEDTDYEFRAVSGGKAVAEGLFRTWASEVPVAETVEIDPATAKYPIRIDRKGTAKGWIRYTAKPGATIGGKDVKSRLFEVKGAEYVLIEGLTVVGGGGYSTNPMWISDSRCVRVRNCEFYGWGRTGRPSFEKFANGSYGGGKFVDAEASVPGRPPRLINYDCAIGISRGASCIVVERCYAHDPRGRANSWYYSHPAGPEAVLMDYADHSCVIRYNDFIGSDNHRWNDAVEGAGNFVADGGFNQDADVYGNFMIYCNDDNIELDGGQQNVRCFQNRFEAALSGVSIQGCCASPVYVFDNLFSGMCEEFGYVNPSIKTSTFSPWWYAPYAGVWGNVYQDPDVTHFCPRQGASARWDIHDNVGLPDPDQATLAKYPVRPLGLTLDTGRIAGVKACGATVSPASRTVTIRSTAADGQAFKVRQNFDADWFAVAPDEGVVPAGGEVKLTVTFDPERMRGRRLWRSAFTVRTPEGFSRVVSVCGERTDYTTPERPLPPSDDVIYAPAPTGAAPYEFSFEVKKAGRYWFHLLAKGGAARFPLSLMAVDGEEPKETGMWLFPDYPVWSMIRPGRRQKLAGVTPHFDLQPGVHRLSVKPMKGADYTLYGAALTAIPLPFEPK